LHTGASTSAGIDGCGLGGEEVCAPDPRSKRSGEQKPDEPAATRLESVSCQWLFPAHNRELTGHEQLANGVRNLNVRQDLLWCGLQKMPDFVGKIDGQKTLPLMRRVNRDARR
jgi:hypothetical protein